MLIHPITKFHEYGDPDATITSKSIISGNQQDS